MKERIKKLEKKRISKKSDDEMIVDLAKGWKIATSKQDWKKAKSIRSQAQTIFNAHPAWLERTSGLRLPKAIFIEWFWFVNFQDKKIQQQYKQAIKKGLHPNVALIGKGGMNV